jgi:acyl-CoA dehydrogenase
MFESRSSAGRLRVPPANNFSPDRGSFLQRAAVVASAAAAQAAAVDRDARFSKAAIDAARHDRLLGVQLPDAFGGARYDADNVAANSD